MYSRYPTLDLHGEFAVTAYTVVHEFLKEQYLLNKEWVVLIHGKGTGKLRQEVLQILKKEPNVIEYYLDPNNLGETIVHLKKRKL